MSKSVLRSLFSRLVPVSAAVVLGGCTFTGDGGMSLVQDMTAARLNHTAVAVRSEDDEQNAGARVSALLAKPLTADAAVQIALLNNRDLQAAYNALGVAEARRIRASLPANPIISLSRLNGGGGFEIERQIAVNILSLMTLPIRTEIATDRFRQAQLQAAAETLRIAMEARRAWIQAVSTRALAGFLVQSQSSAQAAADLSARLGETGASNKLDQARNQVFYAELTGQLATARKRAAGSKETLTRLMGLWGDDVDFRLPSDLPPLPSHPRIMATIETEAVKQRIDLEIARLELAALSKSYGLSGATRFINLLEVAGRSNRKQEPEGDPVTERGLGVEFQIPIFDFGEANVREAEQAYMQAVNKLIAKAVTVRSEARAAYHDYRAAFDIAQLYRRDVLPLRKIISDETLLRYNAMQIDVFSLLTEARARIQSTTAAIEAARDFRLAETALASAVIGGAALSTEIDSSTVAAAESAGGH